MVWTNIIPWGISAGALIVAIIVAARNGKKDIKQECQEENGKLEGIKEALIKLETKLDQVCATTSETRTDIKAMRENLNAVEKRVTLCENEMKTMWVRIDEIKNAIKK